MAQFAGDDGVPSCINGVKVTDVHFSLVSDFVDQPGVQNAFRYLEAPSATSAH
ncbi:hypothetical protein [Cupriavidus basilensis]|uniref:hypothetical protein n=1 Tax=Cupriavidus basilensis TaxID=68895 RepID=UPI0023E8FA9A|nr:hypothetical protein [Cupriavidus basilensis]MDF3886726.1 hypothetical protein [Cupriavidus basilensis]